MGRLPMLQYLRKLSRGAKDRGATAVEYALMVAAIAAVIVGVVFGLGSIVRGAFSDTCTSLANGPVAGTASGAAASCSGK
jgi:pilus assembly protein Flp/PilA